MEMVRLNGLMELDIMEAGPRTLSMVMENITGLTKDVTRENGR